jgi:hypothetical protein
MIVKEGANKALIKPFLEQSQQAELIAENFLANWATAVQREGLQAADRPGQAGSGRSLPRTARPDVLADDGPQGPGHVDRQVDPALQRGLRRRLIV